MTSLPDHPIPCDINAEKATIGSILAYPACMADVAPLVPDEDAFTIEEHRVVYRAIKAVVATGAAPDAVTLRRHLERSSRLKGADGVNAIIDLVESVASAANAEHYARIVRDCHRRRLAMGAMHRNYSDLADVNGQDVTDVIGEASRQVAMAADFGAGAELELIDAIARRAVPEKRRAAVLESGIPALSIYGPYLGDYVVLGARPSTGKTSLLLQVAVAVAASERHALFLTQEQTPEQIAQRIISRYSGVPVFDLKCGGLRGGNKEAVGRAIEKLSELRDHLHLVGRLPHVEAMHALVNRVRRRVGELALVVVDHIQLVSASGKHGTRNEELSKVSATIASWRHDGPCVLVASQLNRDAAAGKPSLHQLRDSGCIEQDADSIWLLHQNGTYSGPEPRQIELVIAKQRNGPTGSVYLTFHPREFAFTEAQ